MHTYHLSIDTADDGTFTHDLSTRLLSLEWRLGCESADEPVANTGFAEIHLDNADGSLSPERTSEIRAGMWARIQATDGLTTHTLFTGIIDRISPQPGAHGKRTVRLIARTVDAPLENLSAHLPQIINASADDLLRSLLELLPLRRPALATLWVLGDPVSQMDSAQLASSLPVTALFDSGISTFAFVTFEANLSALDIARQIVAAERGRLMVDRAGRLVFFNRHAALFTVSPVAVFDDDIAGMDYEHHPTVNYVSITVIPREIGAPGTLLWSSSTALRVPPGLRSIVARYRLENGDFTNVLALQGLTFATNTESDGAGDPVALQAVIAQQGADAAVIEFRNNTARPVYVLPGAALYGTPLIAAAPVSVEAVDQTGIAHSGFRGRNLNLPLIDSLDEAANIADFELRYVGNLAETAHWIEVDLNHRPDALALEPMQRITIRESQTGHDRDYWIIGEAHRVDLAGARHIMRLFLSPASPQPFWEIGTAALAELSALAY